MKKILGLLLFSLIFTGNTKAEDILDKNESTEIKLINGVTSTNRAILSITHKIKSGVGLTFRIRTTDKVDINADTVRITKKSADQKEQILMLGNVLFSTETSRLILDPNLKAYSADNLQAGDEITLTASIRLFENGQYPLIIELKEISSSQSSKNVYSNTIIGTRFAGCLPSLTLTTNESNQRIAKIENKCPDTINEVVVRLNGLMINRDAESFNTSTNLEISDLIGLKMKPGSSLQLVLKEISNFNSQIKKSVAVDYIANGEKKTIVAE